MNSVLSQDCLWPLMRMACATSQAPADVLKQQVLGLYSRLPKTGKPQAHEHTVLAGYAVTADGCPDQAVVVALGTGTKCLPASKRSRNGALLHDSHAEVIARRALLAWVYTQLQLALQQHNNQAGNVSTATGDVVDSIDHLQKEQQQPHRHGPATAARLAAFSWDPQLAAFQWRPGLRLHMYITQPPCGDASIYQLNSLAAGPLPAAPHSLPPSPSAAAAAATAATRLTEPCLHAYSKFQQPGDAPQQQLACGSAAGMAESAIAAAGLACAGLTGRTGAKLIKLGDAADVAGAPGAGCPPQTFTDPCSYPQPSGCEQQELAHKVRPQQQLQVQLGQQQALHWQQEQQAPKPPPQQGHAREAPQVPQAHEVESGPQQLGALRRKPGRGEATLSMSCSDKMARWACLGLQGALLSSLLAQPLYLDRLVVSTAPPAVMGPLEGYDTTAPQEVQQTRQCAAPSRTDSATMTTAAAASAVAAAAAAETRVSPSTAMTTALHRALADRLAPAAAHLAAREAAAATRFRVQPPCVAVATPVEEVLGLAPSSSRKSPSGFSISWSATGGLLQAVEQQQQQQQRSVAPAEEASDQRVPGLLGETNICSSMRLVQCAVGAGEHDVTLAAVGTKAGAPKAGGARASIQVRPRLCGAALTERFLQLVEHLPPGAPVKQQVCTWQAAAAPGAADDSADLPTLGGQPPLSHLKEHVAGDYIATWAELRQAGLFAAWLPKMLPGQGR